MKEIITPLSESPMGTWNLPAGEERRQAIAPLRGYAYQLHQSVAAWIGLPAGATLHLEVAEDYATIANDPKRLDEVLTAIQVKDTRESGAVTLNSGDVLEAIAHFWNLQEANPGREVRLIFLTTSPVGSERKNRLENGVPGLEAWRQAAEGGELVIIRKALTQRLTGGTLADFVRNAGDDELREQLLRRITFACGSADSEAIETHSRAKLVELRQTVKSSMDLAERAYDVLLVHLVKTITKSQERVLTHDQFVVEFTRATSIAVPSQIVEESIGKEPAPKTLSEGDLRRIAESLLASGSPPSLLPLFPGASNSARQALDELAQVRRLVTYTTTTIDPLELTKTKELHHLLVAPPGSGKTHALWHLANQMLEGGDLIPLYLPLGELESSEEILQALRNECGATDLVALFTDPRICVVFDGWSEFADGRSNERAIVRRLTSRTRVLGSARSGSDSDSFFRIWNLEALPASAVRRAIKTAHPSVPFPDPPFLEFLRLPLALSLFVLLDAPVLTRGALIERLHAHLSRELPERFLDVVGGAAATLSLVGSRSYARLQSEVRDRANLASIAEPSKILARLGTLENRGGTVLPVHDLYWHWLSGIGFLKENLVRQSATNLSTREGYQLALESGARSTAEMIDSSCPIDVIFASVLGTGAGIPAKGSVLAKKISEMFSDDRLPIRYRAALASFHSREASFLRPSLDVMAEVISSGLYPRAIESALVPSDIFPERGNVAQWIGAAGSEVFINSIAARGGAEWGPWLEQLAHSGKLSPLIAAAAALACEGRIPKWTVEHLPKLIKTQSWKLRPTAERGANVELADWLAAHYEEYVEDARNSRWIDLNRVIVSCGNEGIFNRLLSRFSSLTKKAQETFGFAIVQLGDPWLGRFQKQAFIVGGATHHHQLAEALSSEIDNETARRWIANGYFEPGWRVLIARHGNTIVPEMLANLPESFDGMANIPVLSAMRFLTNPPESLLDEIWGRMRGQISPKVMQDAIYAIARVRSVGIPSIVRQIAASPTFLPTYHLDQFLPLLKSWEKETGMRIMVQTQLGAMSFEEWILLSRFPKDKDDRFFRDALSRHSELAIRQVLNEFRTDHKSVRQLLERIEPLLGYHAELFDYLVGVPDLFDLIPKIFSQAFDTFPEDAVLRAVMASGDKFGQLLRGLALSSTPTHRTLHKQIVRRVLTEKLNLFEFREVAKVLRVHPRGALLELLQGVISDVTANEIWLIREIEAESHELLIDEEGRWLQ